MNNILVFNKDSTLSLSYKYKGKCMNINFYEKFIFKINDFDFSNYNTYTNLKISNSELSKNDHWIYDIHFFVHSMIKFISKDKLIKIDKPLYENLIKFFFLIVSQHPQHVTTDY